MEEAVLGACMLERSGYEKATEILNSECFYVNAHQNIFTAMANLAARSQPIDSLTVTEELSRMGKLEETGGRYAVDKLTTAVVSGANIIHHGRIILQKYLLREIIRIGGEMVNEAYTDSTDVFDLLEDIEQNVLSIRTNNLRKPFKVLSTILVENIKEIEKLRHRKQHLTGVSSGYRDMDMVTCGWQNSDLIILAARPSVGKTAFALNLARNAAKNNTNPVPVAVFSLEMKDSQLVNRMLSAESGMWLWKLRNADIDDDGMKMLFAKGAVPLSEVPIFIDDTPSLNIAEFRSKARQLVYKHKVGMIIIDYLQLMTVTGINNREQQIAKISSELKATAKELNVPIIALSQLSRNIEQRGGEKEPKLSDLRESGAIEQDADMVMFLWRPSDEEIQQDFSLANTCYVKIGKNRSGALGKFIGEFQKEIQKWNFLKIVDEVSLKPIGSTWKPIDTRPSVNYSEPSNSNNDLVEPGEDLPF